VKTVLVAAGIAWMLAASSPAYAQGNSQNRKNKPPSRNELAVTAVAAPAPAGVTPLAWIDDASLLGADMLAVSMSASRWSGGGVSEVDIPVVDIAYGLAPRVQLAMSVPRVVGGVDPDGAAGGIGTSFFSAKIALYEAPGHSFKVAVSPTMQVLGKGVAAALGPDVNRFRWGLPLSGEISAGAVRVYGGGGYFTPGLWYSGGAVAVRATQRTFVSGGVSRAWRTSDLPDVPLSSRDRKEISGGAAYVVTPLISVFGSIGHTVATLEENGAGTSIAGGVSFAFVTVGR
jgi:hypothetical protein